MTTGIRVVSADLPAHVAGAGRLSAPPLLSLCRVVPCAGDEPSPIVISEPGSLFLIQEGAADLFAVAQSIGGRWIPLGRAAAGVALAPAVAPGSGQRIVARPVPGSAIVAMPMANLTGVADLAAADRGIITELARAVDRGLGLLAAAIAGPPPPRTFVAVDAGTTIQLQHKRFARSVDGVLWVDVVSGSIHVGRDQRHARHHGGDRVCLTESDFLAADTDAVLRTRGTAELLIAGTLSTALQLHGNRFGYAVARAVEQLVDDEADRLTARRQQDARVDQQTRRTLDRLLSEDSQGRYVGVEAESDAARVLRMVGTRCGVRIPDRLPQLPPNADDRSTVEQLAATLGVPHRRVRLAGRWWTRQSGPLIGYRRRGGRAVALLRGPRGYVVRDPAGGPDVAVDASVMKELEVFGLMLYAPVPAAVGGARGLLRFGLAGTGRDARRFLLTAVLIAVAELIVPVLTGAVLGRWVPAAQTSLVVSGAVVVMAGAVVVAALTVLQNLAVLRLEGRLDVVLQSAVWAKVLSLPLRFYGGFSAAELGTRTLGITATREALSSAMTVAVIGAVSGLANLGLLFCYSPRLGLVCCAIIAVGALAGLLLARAGVAHQRRLYQSERKLASVGYQLLSGVATLRQAAAESRAYARWAQVLAASVSNAVAVRRNQSAIQVVTAAVCALCTLSAFALAGGPLAGSIGLAGFLSFYTALSLVLAALQQFAATAVSAYPVFPMIEGLQPILAAEPEEQRQRAQPGELEGRIDLRDISFRYADGPLVLDGITFRIDRGEFVALVGATGSGKSTVLRLLLGFEEPASGSILFDGQDMRQLDLRGLRRQCGVVLQNGTLLADDIAANILAGRPYTEDDAWRAAELAGIADDIKAMPMGMRTVLAEGGGTLSGGQRQRLMIARALLTSPRILFFDEATSALDNATQRIVAESTRRLKATRLVIAHRLSTVVDADRIIVLDHGRVVQSGTYEQLAAEPGGPFAVLVQRQRFGDL